MGWPPAVVIVVRHGARMDAADSQWHLTSPTPYDPPLTFGGWSQSKALGARIASLLRIRETDDELITPGGLDDQGINKRKRRHKVIIHTSPFLRCVQTSIAISAGLAENPGHIHHRPSSSNSQRRKAQMHSSPRIRPKGSEDSPSLVPIPEPLNVGMQTLSQNIKKAILRVDACLGEWLNPEYFEQITPPPSSTLMVAGAKADLLRKEDYTYLTTSQTIVRNQGFPGGWGSPTVLAKSQLSDLPTLSSLAQALPLRDRTSSLGNAGSNGTASRNRARSPGLMTVPTYAEHGVYQPPVPAHAISPIDPIPPGYVAHARDACVDIDYQWDSMREPQSWGYGGEYGEEWSYMHRRFRKGLEKMIAWYNESDDPGHLVTKTPTTHALPSLEETDEDTDLVIILVSHGAGCNALIGALTNQPVLLDVGMSSLTMAVRKPTPVNSPLSSPGGTPRGHSRANSKSLSLSDQYVVKLVANTEHLRSASTTPLQSRTASTSGLFRERNAPFDGSLDGSYGSSKGSRSLAASGNFGSMRRAASVANPGPRNFVFPKQSSIGLWSAPAKDEELEEPEPDDDIILNFGDEDPATSSPPATSTPPTTTAEAWAKFQETEKEDDDIAPPGLWGNPKSIEIHRSSPAGILSSPKRRWTINERA